MFRFVSNEEVKVQLNVDEINIGPTFQVDEINNGSTFQVNETNNGPTFQVDEIDKNYHKDIMSVEVLGEMPKVITFEDESTIQVLL